MSKAVKLSVVIPCFNEVAVLPATQQRLVKVLESITPEFEILYVDDGSIDGTLELLKQLVEVSSRVRVISLSRNFGQQVAITAGLEHARGEAVVILDADLQDPPELITQLVAKWQEGYEIVLAQRTARAGETETKQFTARLFYKVLNLLSEVPIPENTGDFRLLSRRVVDALNALPERDRFLRGLSSWLGFKTCSVPYEREARAGGSSNYTSQKMVRLALDGLLSFSIRPLRLATLLGFLSGFVALLGIIYALVVRLFTQQWVSGWTTLMLAVLFMGGVQLVCLGIIGEYVGRIYYEVKRRPLYVVKERVGFDGGERGDSRDGDLKWDRRI